MPLGVRPVIFSWQLGMTESICLTILAGFCVDYIVHFAHSFVKCTDRSDRKIRAAYAMGHMASPAVSHRAEAARTAGPAGAGPHTMDCHPKDGPNHLGMRCNALSLSIKWR